MVGKRLLAALIVLSSSGVFSDVSARAIIEDHSKSFYGEKDGTASPEWRVEQIRQQSQTQRVSQSSNSSSYSNSSYSSSQSPVERPAVQAERIQVADLSPVGQVGVSNLEPVVVSPAPVKQDLAPVSALAIAPAAERSSSFAPVISSALNDSRKGREVGMENQGSFNWPTKGTLLSSYGEKRGGLFNDGINISAPSGRDIRAAQEGTVVYVGDELKGYGNLVIIRHKNRYMSGYAHLKKATVAKGDRVRKGQVIGYVGESGNVDRPQLHFTVRHNNVPVNPMALLAG